MPTPTRQFDVLAEAHAEAPPVIVVEMSYEDAVAVLIHGLEPGPRLWAFSSSRPWYSNGLAG